MNKKNSRPKAFSIVELSFVLLIVSLLVFGTFAAKQLIAFSTLSKAQSLTGSSSVGGIEDLALWLETTSEKSFLTGEAVDGGAISQWNDINPRMTVKNNAIQSTALNKPLYTEGAISGLPVLRFDGSSDSMLSSFNIDYAVNPNVTIFAVYNNRSGGGTNQALFGNDNGGWDRFLLMVWPSANSNVSTGSTSVQIAALNKLDNPQILTLSLQNGVTNGSKGYGNGVLSVTFTESHGNSGDSSLTIGKHGPSLSGYGKVDIGEIIVFSRALSDPERQEVERYLSKKWGITIS